MNSELLLKILASMVIFFIGSYYIYKIITLLKNRSIAMRKGEDIFFHKDMFSHVALEVFGCILQIALTFFTLRYRLIAVRYLESYQVEDLWFNIIFFSSGMVVFLIKLIYTIIHYKVPFVITDKFFIINGSIHRSSKIFYSYLDEYMILAKEYYQGKTNELLRISMEESKIIQVIRNHSVMKDISLITCIKEENDNTTTGY